MAAVKGYGQRRRKATKNNVSIFSTPVRSQPRIDVLEIADELASLSIRTPDRTRFQTFDRIMPAVKERQVLGIKSGNEGIKTPSRPTDKKSIASPRQPSPIVQLTTVDDKSPRIPDVYHTHVADLLRYTSRDITPFADWSSKLAGHFRIAKIAEASYGEVYRLSLLHPHPDLTKADESVLKIIAIKPPPSSKKLSKKAQDKIETMSDPADVANEVRLIQHMTCVPGFTDFRDICVLQGRPGPAFVAAWQDWHTSRVDRGEEGSTYPDPGLKTSYDATQLWAVIEMRDAGTDLERVQIDSVFLAWDVFWKVAISVAKGEESAEFEHRDLHMGNICVSSRHLVDDVIKVDAKSLDTTRKLGFTDVATTIIDYTISRARIDGLTSDTGNSPSLVTPAGAGVSDLAYLDLSKNDYLFTGDSDEEYQYDIYRYMRGLVYARDCHAMDNQDNPTKDTKSVQVPWRDFHPLTNLVWLHFILYTISLTVHWPSTIPARRQKTLSKASGPEGVVHRRTVELETALDEVEALLDVDALGKGADGAIESAGQLVELALARGWLDEEDVICA